MNILFSWTGGPEDPWMNAAVSALMQRHEVCIKGPRPLLEQLSVRFGRQEHLSYIRRYSADTAKWMDCVFCAETPPSALLDCARYIFVLDTGTEPHALSGYDFLFTALPLWDEDLPRCRSALEVGEDPEHAAELMTEVVDFISERFLSGGRFPYPVHCGKESWREDLSADVSRRELWMFRRFTATETCIARCEEMDPDLNWGEYYAQQMALCQISLSGKVGQAIRPYRDLRRTVSQFKCRYYLRNCRKTDPVSEAYRYACMYALRQNKELLEEYSHSEQPHESLCYYCGNIYWNLEQKVFAAECYTRYIRECLGREEPLYHTDTAEDRKIALRCLFSVLSRREGDDDGQRLELIRAYLAFTERVPEERPLTVRTLTRLQRCMIAEEHEAEAEALNVLIRTMRGIPEDDETEGEESEDTAEDREEAADRGDEWDGEFDETADEDGTRSPSQEQIADSEESQETDESWEGGSEEEAGEPEADGEPGTEERDFSASSGPAGAVSQVFARKASLPKKAESAEAPKKKSLRKVLRSKWRKSRLGRAWAKVHRTFRDASRAVRRGAKKRFFRAIKWWKGLFGRIGRYAKKNFAFVQTMRKVTRPLRNGWQDLRRALGIFSTDQEKDVLRFKDIYRDRACFIIGNGPSLRAEDLERIQAQGYVCFASNKIYKIYELTDWRPDYYGCIDEDVFNQNLQDILSKIQCPKFLHQRMRKSVRRYERVMQDPVTDVHYCRYRWREHPRFFPQVANTLSGGSVTFTLMELAWMMGFREMYVIGCDHFYNAFQNLQEGQETLSSDQNTSNDYFIKNYMKPGEVIRVGKLDRLTGGYVIAKQYADRHGGSIKNATRGGYLEVFERVDLDQLLAQGTGSRQEEAV